MKKRIWKSEKIKLLSNASIRKKIQQKVKGKLNGNSLLEAYEEKKKIKRKV